MPRKLVTGDGRGFFIREVALPPLGDGEVRVRVEFAAPKHGTELHSLGGSVFDEKRWDSELRLFLDRPAETASPAAPRAERGVGNMVVGTVEQAGAAVAGFSIGERVFGYGGVQELVTGSAAKFRPVGDLSVEDAVCVDPAHVALVAVRDGQSRIGDAVAVFGLGAIGLMAVQLARAGGAHPVFAVDPVGRRRDAALALGADAAFDPAAGDVALAIKEATGRAGVDVAIETSGNGRALNDAVRCIRLCATVVHVPWGPKNPAGLRFDAEFHLNRPTLVASQAWEGWGCADRDYPRWDHQRAWDATVDAIRRGCATGKGVIDPIVHFEDAPNVLGALLHTPEQAIKVGIRF